MNCRVCAFNNNTSRFVANVTFKPIFLCCAYKARVVRTVTFVSVAAACVCWSSIGKVRLFFSLAMASRSCVHGYIFCVAADVVIDWFQIAKSNSFLFLGNGSYLHRFLFVVREKLLFAMRPRVEQTID